MPQKSKTPAGTGASRDSFGGLSLNLSSVGEAQVQFLIAAYHVRPEMVAMIAASVFGGGSL